MREFDTDTVRMISLFESITEAEVRDCVKSEDGSVVYFVLNPGHAPKAVGKSGSTVKIAEKMLGKRIKVFEYSPEPREFLKNLVPRARSVEIREGKAIIRIGPEDKGIVIGRNGKNIKVIREILKRNSGISSVEVR